MHSIKPRLKISANYPIKNPSKSKTMLNLMGDDNSTIIIMVNGMIILYILKLFAIPIYKFSFCNKCKIIKTILKLVTKFGLSYFIRYLWVTKFTN